MSNRSTEASGELTQSLWLCKSQSPLHCVTLAGAARRSAASRPDTIALVDGVADSHLRRRWTYLELTRDMDAVARTLLSDLSPGDRVMVCSPNRPEASVLQFALSAAGLILVPVNPAYRYEEVVHIANTTGARAFFHSPDYRGNDLRRHAERLLSDTSHVEFAYNFDDWDEFFVPSSCELPWVDPESVGMVIFTSGTTGKPKGAMLRHSSMVNTAIQTLERSGLGDVVDPVWINSMPLYSMGGAGSPTHATAWFAGTHVLMRDFDADLILDLIEQEQGTITLAVPTMLTLALERQTDAPRRLSSLRAIITGASTVPEVLVDKVYAATGAKVLITYGQTESHGSVSGTNVLDTSGDTSQTVGRPNEHLDIGIFEASSTAILPIGTSGEIRVRGHQVMDGYIGAPDETAATVDSDGWLKTGDIGSMDSRGYLRIVGRLKDVIIRGGTNVYPREIEETIARNEAVGDVAIIGLPHPKWGEEVAAVVRLNLRYAPESGLAVELAMDCADGLARFKVPRHWFFVNAFPLTPSGKIVKPALVQDIVAGRLQATLVVDSINELMKSRRASTDI